MPTRPTSSQEASYLCRSCQKFFSADVSQSVECPDCRITQPNPESWEKVIQARSKGLKFNNAKIVYHAPEDRSKADFKLNIIERKKTKHKLMLVALAFAWIGGLSLLGYKATEKNKTRENSKSSTALSANKSTKKIQQQLFTQAWPSIQKFLLADNSTKRSDLTYNIDDRILYLAFNNQSISFPKDITQILASQYHGSYAELLVGRENGKPIEIVMLEKEGKWLIDWDHFSNSSTMLFRDFLIEKPTTEHNFRLYFTVDNIASTKEITFIDAQPNNDLFDDSNPKRVRIKFPSNHPLRADIDKLVNLNKDFKSYNSTLSTDQRSILGSFDPKRYNRVNVTLKWVKKDDRMVTELVAVNAAHWIGSHWAAKSTPAQDLTLTF